MEDFSNHRYISLATYRKTGKEVRTPVWFADEGDHKILCFSAENAGKVKRLRRSSQARIASCNISGADLGTWFDARAYLVETEHEQEKAYQLLLEKYGFQMRVTNLMSWLTGKINHRTVIRIEWANKI